MNWILIFFVSFAFSTQAMADPKPVSAATAKAKGASTFSAGQCQANCARIGGISGTSATCRKNCRPGTCYFNSNTGNYYCVR